MLNKKLTFMLVPLLATLSLNAHTFANDPFFQDPFGDDIFKEMMQMQRDMDQMFNQMHQRMQQRSTRLVSPLGTYQIAGQSSFVDKKGFYEYTTNIPENKENQIDINVQDGILAITAKIIETHENQSAHGYSSSRAMRMYQQSMPVPVDADENSLSAKYEKGKLVLTMKKKAVKNSGSHIRIQTPASKQEQKPEDQKITSPEANKTKKTQVHANIPVS